MANGRQFPHVLDELLGAQTIYVDGVAVKRRAKLNLHGVSAVDDATNEWTDITLTGSGEALGRFYDEIRDAIDDAAPGTVMAAKGAAAISDGAFGHWVIDDTGTFTDDGGTVLTPNGYGTSHSKAAVRIYSGARDVRWFLAFPDGTDVSVFLGRAFAGGGPVFVPPGTYTLETSVEYVSNLDLTAWGATFKAKAGTIYNAVISNSGAISNVKVRGLTLDANADFRLDTTNTKDGQRLVGITDAVFDSMTVENCLGTPGSAVGFATTNGERVLFTNCTAIDCGRTGRISDGFYSNGDGVRYSNCRAIRCQDTGFVFENASRSGGIGLLIDGLIDSASFTADGGTNILTSGGNLPANDTQIKLYTTGTLPTGLTQGSPVYVINRNIVTDEFQVSATQGGAAIDFTGSGSGAHEWRQYGGAGIAVGCAGNTDRVDNYFSDSTITNVIAPIEFGLFGANTNTGDLKNTTFRNITIDCPGAGFAAFLFYPNPQVNPGALTYGGRIVNTAIEGCMLADVNGQQGVYATQCDGLTIRDCDFDVSAAAIQTGEGSPTKVVIENNDIDVAATFGMQFATGCDDMLVGNNRIRGTAAMAWAMYFFGTSTNVRTPRNEITGSALNDQSGIGADATTQPRKPADGPDYVTTTPQPATGIWPVGYKLINTDLVTSSPYIETTAKPAGWVVTTAGVPGSGAVFTPFFREGRTAGEAGTLNSGNTIDHVRTPASGGHYVAYNARGDSADASKFVGFGFSNASNAAGNLGYVSADGNGNVRIAALASMSFGFNTNAAFPGTYSEVAQLLADGLCVPGNDDGFLLGSGGTDGGIYHAQSVAAGMIRVGARVRGELGINSNDSFPWATYTAGLYWRAITGATAIGINADPSDRAALLSIAAGSANYDQICIRVSSSIPSAKLDGAVSYTANGLHFCMGTTTRYNVALKVSDVAYNFTTTINAGVQTDLTITVGGALVGDKVLIDFTSGGLDAGLIFGGAWVSASDTVKVRIYNPTGGNITPASVNWNVSVIHT